MEPFIESILRVHNRHRPFTHASFWVLVYGLGLLDPTTGQNAGQRMLIVGLLAFSRVSMAYFVVYWLIPRYLERGRYGLTVFLFVAGSYGMYALLTLLRTASFPVAGLFLPDDLRFPAALLNGNEFLYNHLFSMLGGAAALLLIKLLLNRTEVQRRALTLERQKAELELKLLKTQLNPHFLFNTLNNIYSLAVQESPKTPEAIARLANMLDYMLYQSNGNMVPLSGEIDLLTHYIALEKLRYDDRLRVTFDAPSDTHHVVAPLLLLSIVENAFKHGASADSGRPTIDIAVEITKDRIMFRVENSRATVHANPARETIGLPNLKQQLALLYPETHSLHINQTQQYYEVELSVPALPLSTAYENALPAGGR